MIFADESETRVNSDAKWPEIPYGACNFFCSMKLFRWFDKKASDSPILVVLLHSLYMLLLHSIIPCLKEKSKDISSDRV